MNPVAKIDVSLGRVGRESMAVTPAHPATAPPPPPPNTTHTYYNATPATLQVDDLKIM